MNVEIATFKFMRRMLHERNQRILLQQHWGCNQRCQLLLHYTSLEDKQHYLKRTGHIPHCPSQKSIAKDSYIKYTSLD